MFITNALKWHLFDCRKINYISNLQFHIRTTLKTSDNLDYDSNLQILHTGIDVVERINQSGADKGNTVTNGSNGHIEGSLVIRCKDLRIFQIDIRGYEKFKFVAESLDKLLTATIPDRSKYERSDSLVISTIDFDQIQVDRFNHLYK